MFVKCLLLVVALLLTTPVFSQSPADSVRLFKAPDLPKPMLRLRGFQPFSMNFQPEGFFSPVIDVFGPSDQLPTPSYPFAPPGDAYAGSAGSLQGGWSLFGGLSLPYGDIHLNGLAAVGVATGSDASFPYTQGSVVFGNGQTGLATDLPDWFWVGSAEWSDRELKPSGTQLSYYHMNWAETNLHIFSDPLANGDRTTAFLTISQLKSTGMKHQVGLVRTTVNWDKDLSVGWWKVTGDLTMNRQSDPSGSRISVLTGPVWMGEQAEIGILGGMTRQSKGGSGWMARTQTAWHGQAFHTIFNWQSETVSDAAGLFHESRWWYLPAIPSQGILLINNQMDLSVEWITGVHSLVRLTGSGADTPMALVTDSLTLSILKTRRWEGSLEWLYKPSEKVEVTPGITFLIPAGSIRSFPWEGLIQIHMHGNYISGDGNTRIGASARYHMERAMDTLRRRKTGDMTEFSLKTDDSRLKPLNLFAEFRIIITEDEKSVPGLIMEPFQVTAGFRYQF